MQRHCFCCGWLLGYRKMVPPANGRSEPPPPPPTAEFSKCSPQPVRRLACRDANTSSPQGLTFSLRDTRTGYLALAFGKAAPPLVSRSRVVRILHRSHKKELTPKNFGASSGERSKEKNSDERGNDDDTLLPKTEFRYCRFCFGRKACCGPS